MGKTTRNLPRDNEDRTLRQPTRPPRRTVRQRVRVALDEIAKLTDPLEADPLVPLDRDAAHRYS